MSSLVQTSAVATKQQKITDLGMLSEVCKGCKVQKFTGEKGLFIAFTHKTTGERGTLALGKKSYNEALKDLKVIQLEDGTRIACRQGSSYSVLEEVEF